MADESTLQTMRWYTRARRGLPILIGRTPNGEQIPGGPYTVGQIVVFGSTLLVGQLTMGLWGRFGGIGNFVLLGAVAFGLGWVVSRIPTENLNGWAWIHGARHAATFSRSGTYDGSPVKIPNPHQVTGRVAIDLGDVKDIDMDQWAQEAQEIQDQDRPVRRRATPAQAAWATSGKEW